LTNTGLEDDYSLTFQEVPAGWSAFFYVGDGVSDKLSVRLGSGLNKNIKIYVEAPKSGQITLSVNCASITSKDVKTADIILEAKKVISITIKNTNKVQNVEAGESTIYELDIFNHLDAPEEVGFSIEGNPNIKTQSTPDDTKWSVSLDNTTLIIDSDKSKSLFVTVFAPVSGIPGDSITVVIIADPQVTSQDFIQDLIIRIPKIYNITYTLKQETSLILPNASVNYTLKLFNVGNVNDIINLKVHENLFNWPVYFIKDDVLFNPSVDIIDLKVNDFIEFLVQVFVPLDAKAETHFITYGIYNQDIGPTTPINELKISSKVRLISDIEINIPNAGSTIVDLEKTSYREIEVVNLGNGVDKLSISIPRVSIPADWEIYFYSVKNTQETNNTKTVDFTKPIEMDNLIPTEYKPNVEAKYNNISLILASDQKAYVKLAITPPATGKPGIETLKIYGESIGDNIDTTTKSISVKLRVSALSISEIILDPAEPVPNDKVKISFNVTNNYHLPATDFTVKLVEINGETITDLGSVKIANLDPGASKEVKFTWTAKEANELGYILKATLIGDIIPADNSTPYRTQNVFVTKKPGDDKSQELNTLLLVLVILIIFVFVLIILFFISRKKAMTGELEAKAKDPDESRVKPKSQPPRGAKDRREVNKSKSPPARKNTKR
jgi:hypothetical protein